MVSIFGVKIKIKNTRDAANFKAMLDKHLINYSVKTEGKYWVFVIKGQEKI